MRQSVRWSAVLFLSALLLTGCFRPLTPNDGKEPEQENTLTDAPESISSVGETFDTADIPVALEKGITILQNPGGLIFSEEEVTGMWLEGLPEPIETLDAPDGSGTVFTRDDADGAGGIFWRDSSGREENIFNHVPLRPGGSLGDVHTASITGFLDDTHLVCTYSGYECFRGCGIYDTKSGSWSEHNHFYWRVLGIHDSSVYGWEWGDGYKPLSVWRIDADGTETILGRAGENSHEVWESLFTPERYYSAPDFQDGIWILPSPYTGNEEEGTHLYFFSADTQTLLAEIQLFPMNNRAIEIEGNHVTLRWQ